MMKAISVVMIIALGAISALHMDSRTQVPEIVKLTSEPENLKEIKAEYFRDELLLPDNIKPVSASIKNQEVTTTATTKIPSKIPFTVPIKGQGLAGESGIISGVDVKAEEGIQRMEESAKIERTNSKIVENKDITEMKGISVDEEVTTIHVLSMYEQVSAEIEKLSGGDPALEAKSAESALQKREVTIEIGMVPTEEAVVATPVHVAKMTDNESESYPINSKEVESAMSTVPTKEVTSDSGERTTIESTHPIIVPSKGKGVAEVAEEKRITSTIAKKAP